MEKNQESKSGSGKEQQELPSCCSSKPKNEPKNVGQAVLYGLIPHVGCIAFIIGSVLGVTVLTQLFKPLLMNRNFFYILIAISLLLATVSAMLYLRKTGYFTAEGIKKKWKYLTTMYGVTIGVNVLLFLVIFPMVANLGSAASPSTASLQAGATNGGTGGIDASDLASLQLKVEIPCPGHAPLITNELKTINGVQNVKFSFPNNFEVTYDSSKASKETILALSVFNEYKATVVSEFASASNTVNTANTATATTRAATETTGGCGCGGGGSGGCGGSAGGGCGGCGAGSGAGAGTCGAKY